MFYSILMKMPEHICEDFKEDKIAEVARTTFSKTVPIGRVHKHDKGAILVGWPPVSE